MCEDDEDGDVDPELGEDVCARGAVVEHSPVHTTHHQYLTLHFRGNGADSQDNDSGDGEDRERQRDVQRRGL